MHEALDQWERSNVGARPMRMLDIRLCDQVLTLRTTQDIVQSEGQQVVVFPVNFRQGNIRPHNVHSQ